MDEQPVALATMRRSPNSCVMSFRYGVSPQPEQARPSVEQWPALHPQEQPAQPEYSQPAPGSPQPSQQEPPQGQPVPGQQYPQYQPPQQQSHSDNQYASPYHFEPGAAPREEGPQR